MNKINYRADQLPIINYENGTMAVPAVPGAGKTFIVTNLVAKLLTEGKNEGKKILILAFMNSAVTNFKSRIKKILTDNEIEAKNICEVMTIHSLAIKIIKENTQIVRLSDEFEVADDYQKTIILNECINRYRQSNNDRTFKWFLKEQSTEYWRGEAFNKWEDGFFDVISKSISDLKYQDISPDTLETITDENYKGMLRIVQPIYKEYEKKLRERGLLDYDDMLILAYKVLTLDENVRNKFQEKYKYIFEDECQDSNEIQGKIIKLISNNKNLVRVGDINQSINGTFSSSDPKFFKEFINSANKCHRMDMSNRSSKDVLDVANELVRYVTKDFAQIECREALEDMEIKTVPLNMGYKENPTPDKYSINTQVYKTWEIEIEKTIAYAMGIKNKYPDKSIGILVPYNNQVSEIARKFDEIDVEYEELGANSKHKRKILEKLATIINFTLDCEDKEKLIDVFKKVFIHTKNEQGKKDFINIIRNYTVEEILYDDQKEPIIIDTHSDEYQGYIRGREILKNILQYPMIRIDSFILYIADQLELEKEERTIADYVVFYMKYLASENHKFSLEEAYNILSDKKNKVFTYIIEIAHEINGYEPEAGSITICNYHKSKGLEWDAVFLLGNTDYNFPSNIQAKFQGDRWYLKDKYKNPITNIKSEIDVIKGNYVQEDYNIKEKIEVINEKIRLLYVGITRAKEVLILSYSEYNKKEDIDNKKKKQKYSQYFNVLQRYINVKRNG